MDSDSPFASGLIYEIQDYSVIVSVLDSMFYSWGREFPLTYSRWIWYHANRIPVQMELVGKRIFPFTLFLLACLFALRNQKALDFTKIFLQKEKKIAGHRYFLWSLWYPCFGLLVTSALGFKVRVDPLACHLWVIEFSVSPLVQHLLTFWWPAWHPSPPHPCSYEQALVGLKIRIYHVCYCLTTWEQADAYCLSYAGSAY